MFHLDPQTEQRSRHDIRVSYFGQALFNWLIYDTLRAAYDISMVPENRNRVLSELQRQNISELKQLIAKTDDGPSERTPSVLRTSHFAAKADWIASSYLQDPNECRKLAMHQALHQQSSDEVPSAVLRSTVIAVLDDLLDGKKPDNDGFTALIKLMSNYSALSIQGSF
jgi:hypothetical protein